MVSFYTHKVVIIESFHSPVDKASSGQYMELIKSVFKANERLI